MAKYNQGGDEGDYSNVSTINGGVLKTIRIHEHWKFISLISANLSTYNPDYNDYNYNIKLEFLDRLYLEVESKLKAEEREKADSLRDAIKLFMVNFPVYQTKIDSVNKTQYLQLNKQNYTILKEYIFKYERLIRQLHDNYGLDTRYEDEDEY